LPDPWDPVTMAPPPPPSAGGAGGGPPPPPGREAGMADQVAAPSPSGPRRPWPCTFPLRRSDDGSGRARLGMSAACRAWQPYDSGVPARAGGKAGPAHRKSAARGEVAAAVVSLDGERLTLADCRRIAEGEPAAAAPAAIAALAGSRRVIDAAVAADRPVYGVTTGFGRFADVAISPEQAAELQINLLRSHAAGVGPALPEPVVRLCLALRANSLLKGCSGVRTELVELLLACLNRRIVPVVPSQGSLGASGDLAPLAHLALVLTGRGEATLHGERLPGAEALHRVGLAPLALAPKEGLALINGTQVMTAVAVLAHLKARDLLRQADAIAALTCEALRGIPAAYAESLQQVRPHPGQTASAANLRRCLEGSRLCTRPGELRVQDAYTLRCIPQVHGAARDALAYVEAVLATEVNAATDNPLIFPDAADDEQILSGGNFHGQPVAIAADCLAVALGGIGAMSERRTERLVNPALSGGLPAFLTDRAGLRSGMMLVQYTAAALVAENKVLAHPASVDSIPSSANQEDHVSMGTIAARKAASVVENLARILAAELLCAAQAVDFLDPGALGRGSAAASAAPRQVVGFFDSDQEPGPAIESLAAMLMDGELLRAVAGSIGDLL
jgi:histidine ammonia-lyase